MKNIQSYFAYKYLKRVKSLNTKNVEIEKPIRLLKDLKDMKEKQSTVNICADYFDIDTEFWKSELEDEYKKYILELDKKISIFNNKPYQLGGLDVEVEFIVLALLSQKNPSVLEVGVSNGYSSAAIYWILSKLKDSSITTIDLPRFFNLKERYHSLLEKAWMNRTENEKNKTGTLGDIWPGGIIPESKYGGWLIPISLRYKVRNVTITGNIFNVLNELDDNTFSFVIFDAMKGYDDRMRFFDDSIKKMTKDSILCVDGYWANNAYQNFVRKHGFSSWEIGRIGFVFIKK